MGPVEVMVFTFTRAGLVASVGPVLAEFVASGHLGVLDAIVVSKSASDALVITDLDDSIIPAWSQISTAPRPMLSSADAELAAAGLSNSGAALLIALEHLWPEKLTRLVEDSGGALELHARIDQQSVAAAARVDA